MTQFSFQLSKRMHPTFIKKSQDLIPDPDELERQSRASEFQTQLQRSTEKEYLRKKNTAPYNYLGSREDVVEMQKTLSHHFPADYSPSKIKLSGPLEKTTNCESDRSKISSKINSHIMSTTFIGNLSRMSKSEPRNSLRESEELDEVP